MSTLRITSRYAEAILDAVPEGTTPEAVVQELRDIQASIDASSELKLFFLSPIISQTKKAETVKALFQGRTSDYVISALLLLVEKRREDLILDIIPVIIDLLRARQGVIATAVQSAVEMSEEQRAHLETALETASGKRVEADYVIQPELVAGLVVRLGDTVYDGSVRNQLKRLRDRLISGR
jgi:F-type H+-transporting ATPase subunit delta